LPATLTCVLPGRLCSSLSLNNRRSRTCPRAPLAGATPNVRAGAAFALGAAVGAACAGMIVMATMTAAADTLPPIFVAQTNDDMNLLLRWLYLRRE
jgi:hypothetical protein